MSDKSPLFVSSLELIAQATELYAQKHPRKYKFVILHLANSIELILKDRLIDKGVSIYKPRSSETIGIWNAFEELAKLNVSIPEKPIIELLIDDRNTIQHRFGFPDAQSVYYYLESVVSFFKRFLLDEYNVSLAEALSSHSSREHLEILGLVTDNFTFLNEIAKISPKSAVLEAHAMTEDRLPKLVDSQSTQAKLPYHQWITRYWYDIIVDMERNGYLSSNFVQRYKEFRDLRNKAAHSAILSEKEIKSDKWIEAIQTAKELLTGIEKAENAGYRYSFPGDTNSESS